MTDAKPWFWDCKCGHRNNAPALQTPDNTVVCDECAKEFKWRDVKPVARRVRKKFSGKISNMDGSR